ncbi:MAG: hypothetical protein SGBAC_003565 [Bacillariaceae sp.]
MVGFGFRERDVAVDLLGNLQQFQRSIERELQAKNMKVKEIPKLGEGEKIHIKLGTSKRKSTKASNVNKKTSGGPFLLKKPPKAVGAPEGKMNSIPDMDMAAKKDVLEVSKPESTMEQAAVSNEADDDFGDDWNDFQEGTPSGSSS